MIDDFLDEPTGAVGEDRPRQLPVELDAQFPEPGLDPRRSDPRLDLERMIDDLEFDVAAARPIEHAGDDGALRDLRWRAGHDRDDCLRGVLIHGLALGLDADPDFIDGLAADEGGDDEAIVDGEADQDTDNVVPFAPRAEGELRLFTATIVVNDGFEAVHAFHASLATEEAEVAGRLYCRLGAAAADARIVAGFDPTDPLVAALVSDAICDTLALIAAEPGSPLADGLDVNIEHRFFG